MEAALQQRNALAASLLEIERDRLLCSLSHLERSVRELKQALAEDPDPEYKVAISENLVVIAKQRARVASLEDEIKRAKGMAGDVSHAQVAAVPVMDNAATAAAAPASRQQVPQQAAGDAGGSAMQVDSEAAGVPASGQQQQQQQPQEGQAAPPDTAGGGGMWL